MTDAPEKASPATREPEIPLAEGVPRDQDPASIALLAVDLGLRLGLAAYSRDGALRLYRSTHVGSPAQLRKAVPRILSELPSLTHFVAEGDRALFEIWARFASKAHISMRLVGAETWRESLLPPSQRRTGAAAKASADRLARRIIADSPAKNPTSLRHDAAEAILLGLWAVRDLGWG